jgi:16S rRNA (cytidine1402-2'-O)-methyltransferase
MLYFIPTPIGNLEDISLRALNLFKKLNIFLCEDTRTFKNLLAKYEIDFSNKKFYSITSYTSAKKLEFYSQLIEQEDV